MTTGGPPKSALGRWSSHRGTAGPPWDAAANTSTFRCAQSRAGRFCAWDGSHSQNHWVQPEESQLRSLGKLEEGWSPMLETGLQVPRPAVVRQSSRLSGNPWKASIPLLAKVFTFGVHPVGVTWQEGLRVVWSSAS